MTTRMQALSAAAKTFREYQLSHARQADEMLEKRGPSEEVDARRQKAERNRQMAQMCENAAGKAFQVRVGEQFMGPCFGVEISVDIVERCDRLIEEVFEAVQAVGYDFARIPKLAAYVAARPVGELEQEIGGVMVCLAALCNVENVDMGAEAETELARIIQPDVMEKIRAKQAAKPSMSPLPQ